MPKYNEFLYDTDYYGTRSALAFNAEPMDAVAIDYGYATVYYTIPDGEYIAFRIVRNQEAFPQSESDGAVIYASGEAPDGAPVKDDESFNGAPLVQGRIAYYRAWVQTVAGGDWIPAGDAEALIPRKHSLGLPLDTVYTADNQYPSEDAKVNQDPRISHELSTTHERFMSLFPKVLVTTTNSPLDEIENSYDRGIDESGVNDNSLISSFMSAFSFTVDELITLARLTYPDFAGHGASSDVLALRTHEMGLTSDVEPVTSTQKKLLRNAVQIYKTKGTARALQFYIESVTGYDAVITTTKNLLLTHEDATFDIINWESGDPVGYWATVTGTPTLSVGTSQAPATVSTAVDLPVYAEGPPSKYAGYTAKIETGGTTSSIGLGVTAPITRGIPVIAGQKYSLSFYVQNAASAQVTPEIRWYDRKGIFISAITGTATNSAIAFTRISFADKPAPADAAYACPVIKFSSSATYYLDMVQFEQGTTVTDYYEPRAAYVTIDPDPADSIAIYNRITRVQNEIQDYVPFNSPYYVSVSYLPKTITGVSSTGSVVTYTSAGHGYKVGDVVTITGVDPSGYNLPNKTITEVTANTFKVASTVTGSYVSGGVSTQISLVFNYLIKGYA
jgi:hypothetical protein